MKIIAEHKLLKEVLGAALGVVFPAGVPDVARVIQLVAAGEKCSVTACDGDTGVYMSFPCKVIEAGKASMKADSVKQIHPMITADAEIEAGGPDITISMGTDKFTVDQATTDPIMPAIPQDVAFKIDEGAFVNAFQMVSKFRKKAGDVGSQALEQTHLFVSGDNLLITSTDTYVVSICKIPITIVSEGKFDACIDFGISAVHKKLSCGGELNVRLSDLYVVFECSSDINYRLFTRRGELPYPNVWKFVPREATNAITVNRKKFERAVSLHRSDSVQLDAVSNKLTVLDTESGNQSSTDCVTSGKIYNVLCRSDLKGILSTIKSKEIKVELGAIEKGPNVLLIHPCDDLNIRFYVREMESK